MHAKFIHRAIEIDLFLSDFELVEENQWFSQDDYFAIYSFPTEIDITPEIDRALGMISKDESESYDTILEGDLYLANTHHLATLEIESLENNKISLTITAGLDQFPNWEKQLSELPLHYEDVPGNFFDFAESKINTGYPAINYNFPKVRPPEDKFDTTTDQWESFEGYINNCINGVFPRNEFDAQNVKQINRNIPQPMPYLMHVLKQGFFDAGFELRGDVLDDEELQKAIIETESTYYTNVNADSEEWFLKTNEYGGIYYGGYTKEHIVYGENVVRHFSKTYTISKPGFYVLNGNAVLRTWHSYARVRILVDGVNYFTRDENAAIESDYRERLETVELEFNVLPGQTITIELISNNLNVAKIEDDFIVDDFIFDLTLTQLSKYDAQGNLLPTLVVPGHIDLKKVVPKMTFGTLVKAICKLKNYELKPVGKHIELNRITPQLKKAATVDLSSTEKKSKYRGFQKGKSYILQFEEYGDEKYEPLKVFVDANGYATTNIQKKKDTTEINIPVIVLPQETIAGVTTAFSFIENNEKLKLVVYDHNQSNNETVAPSSLNTLTIFENDYKDFLFFRINAKIYIWKFIKNLEQAFLLTTNDKVKAYGREHVIKKLTKKVINKDFVETEIETES